MVSPIEQETDPKRELLRGVVNLASVGEWWSTDSPSALVVLVAGKLVRVVVSDVPAEQYPDMTPNEWAASDKPHPFGYIGPR